jgi:hypothetical protein
MTHRASRRLLAAFAFLVVGTAHAHEAPSTRVREIVRAQGHLGGEPSTGAIVRTAELTVLGEPRRLYATEWRTFRLDGLPESEPPSDSAPFTLQGSRQQLRRVRDARRDQLLTLLAERRPGSRDLFLLAVDLCPPD